MPAPLDELLSQISTHYIWRVRHRHFVDHIIAGEIGDAFDLPRQSSLKLLHFLVAARIQVIAYSTSLFDEHTAGQLVRRLNGINVILSVVFLQPLADSGSNRRLRESRTPDHDRQARTGEQHIPQLHEIPLFRQAHSACQKIKRKGLGQPVYGSSADARTYGRMARMATVTG
jgi:hypothetical protein